MGQNEIVRFWW